MAEKEVEVRTGLVPDPENVPVTFANVFAGGGAVSGVINFTLCVARLTPTFDGKTDNDIVVASRLRVDLDTAVLLRNFLNSQIEMLAPPKGQAN